MIRHLQAERCRPLLAVGAFLLAGACGGSSTGPSRASLTFTFSSNPVPSAGVSAACVGTPAKNWFWTVSIRNTGSAPFTAASFQNTVNVPGFGQIVTPGTASDFVDLFGTTTIAPNTTVQSRQVCIGLTNPPSAVVTTVSTLTGQSGEFFTTPTLQLLP